jgi:2-dehydro-3-deoxy-D-pentonate aldolase
MATPKKFRGFVPPVITPVTPSGSLDEEAVGRIIEHVVGGGADGVFIVGTTGECASVSAALRRRYVQIAAARLRGRVPLYVGIGENCFDRSTEAAAESFSSGADGVVAQLPSYFPLTPDQMYSYYAELADRVEGPLFLYNIPSTTHMSIPVDVVARLAGHPRIAGFKDSENNAERHDELYRRLTGLDGFSLFVGVGVLMGRGLLAGADGIVPSSGNLDPRSCRDLCDAASRGDAAEVERLQLQINRVSQVFQRGRTLGQSLAAIKVSMSALGLCGTSMLPPLQALGTDEHDFIRQGLAELGLVP